MFAYVQPIGLDGLAVDQARICFTPAARRQHGDSGGRADLGTHEYRLPPGQTLGPQTPAARRPPSARDAISRNDRRLSSPAYYLRSWASVPRDEVESPRVAASATMSKFS